MENHEGQIVLGECFSVMKTLSEISFDLIVTDPPLGAMNPGAYNGLSVGKRAVCTDFSSEHAENGLKSSAVWPWAMAS